MTEQIPRGLSTEARVSMEIRCSTCGVMLTLKDGGQLSDVARSIQDLCRHTTTIFFVQPCRACVAEEVGPARALSKAIHAMLENKGCPQ